MSDLSLTEQLRMSVLGSDNGAQLDHDVAEYIDKLEAALLDAYIETNDLGLCPYTLRGHPVADPEGICDYGCTEEPECMTCVPEEGWLTQRHPVLVEIAIRDCTEEGAS
jgi:hypothetical protein